MCSVDLRRSRIGIELNASVGWGINESTPWIIRLRGRQEAHQDSQRRMAEIFHELFYKISGPAKQHHPSGAVGRDVRWHTHRVCSARARWIHEPPIRNGSLPKKAPCRRTPGGLDWK